jgi:hypothetical protein
MWKEFNRAVCNHSKLKSSFSPDSYCIRQHLYETMHMSLLRSKINSKIVFVWLRVTWSKTEELKCPYEISHWCKSCGIPPKVKFKHAMIVKLREEPQSFSWCNILTFSRFSMFAYECQPLFSVLVLSA